MSAAHDVRNSQQKSITNGIFFHSLSELKELYRYERDFRNCRQDFWYLPVETEKILHIFQKLATAICAVCVVIPSASSLNWQQLSNRQFNPVSAQHLDQDWLQQLKNSIHAERSRCHDKVTIAAESASDRHNNWRWEHTASFLRCKDWRTIMSASKVFRSYVVWWLQSIQGCYPKWQ